VSKMQEIGLSHRAKARPAVTEAVADAVGNWRNTIRPISTKDQRPIRPERLMADIYRMMTPETMVVADASYSSIWIANYLTCRAPVNGFSRLEAWRDWAGGCHWRLAPSLRSRPSESFA
jgi:thiamine pyrophosphate-dependent acetolactate synthase large subunit-like protein